MASPRHNSRPAALGAFNAGPKLYGFVPAVPRQRGGLSTTPALEGLFRAGKVVGISQINAMATNVTRGSGA
jgi:hypothetical protein